MSIRPQVLRMLADGRFRSGSEIGAHLGVSRAAVRKAVEGLQSQGLTIYAVRGRGYCLERPVEPLEPDRLLALARARGLDLDGRVRVLAETDSTSSEMARAGHPGTFCLAEHQGAGRGRRGRRWEAPAWRNLFLSLAWRFESGVQALSGLSLAVGVAVVRVLHQAGFATVGLKWPNDVVAGGRKLGGVLVEVRGEAGGPCLAIIGLGLNLDLDTGHADRVDLRSLGPSVPGRNELCAAIMVALTTACEQFARDGFAAFRAEWNGAHAFAGEPVRLVTPTGEVNGTVLDIDERGALRLQLRDGSIGVFDSGEVSLRAVA